QHFLSVATKVSEGVVLPNRPIADGPGIADIDLRPVGIRQSPAATPRLALHQVADCIAQLADAIHRTGEDADLGVGTGQCIGELHHRLERTSRCFRSLGIGGPGLAHCWP
ncbi:MAG: hypothetical protein ACK56F_31740, partial [bacterium]